ncbi:hypothetical protein [Methanoregula sp.]|uniref:hypothetical protein n=1 Tax=Methanoregula sp. TaxID=2052170 RepID=UPI003C709A7F
MTPNTPVTVSFNVAFAASSGYTFPAGSDLVMTTDLANPKWTYTVVLNTVENPRNPVGGPTLDLSGFELSYASTVDESLSVTLEGTAPTVATTTNQTILDVHEVDSNGDTVTSSEVTQSVLVINPGDVQAAINNENTNLTTLRSDIDEKSAIGVDTTDAEADYNDASSKLSSAKARPATQYSDAFNDIAAAQASIDAGETALDKSWAEMVVANAQGPVTNADGIIAWFKGNTSTANDPQLSSIVTEREIAVSYISNANDFITNGNYDQARSKAQQAYNEGNQSYTDALARQYTLTHGTDIIGMVTGIFKSGVLVIVVGIVAVVLIAVGIIIYRKRSSWDELG